jgi:hypothetical protein
LSPEQQLELALELVEYQRKEIAQLRCAMSALGDRIKSMSEEQNDNG